MKRVAVVCDFLEENWPSMDLVGDMLCQNLSQAVEPGEFSFQQVRPAMRRRFGARGFTMDRLLNRFWDYPRMLRRGSHQFDLFHIVDHSYSQLVHNIPADCTVVTCHDIDTFRSVLEPERVRRSLLFRQMTRRILEGMSKAAAVLCDSEATRQDVLRFGLVPPDRTHLVPLSVHPTCSPLPNFAGDEQANRLLGEAARSSYMLHVGSTIPRKRIDILLQVFAAVNRKLPGLKLVRVGGAFTPEQAALANQLGITNDIVVLPFLTREVLAAVYRRAEVVVLTSEAEGFGLPVAEAMACGCPVISSNLSVLREVGGTAAEYCSLEDLTSWCEAIVRIIEMRREDATEWRLKRKSLFATASRFSWSENARQTVAIYRSVLGYSLEKTYDAPSESAR